MNGIDAKIQASWDVPLCRWAFADASKDRCALFSLSLRAKKGVLFLKRGQVAIDSVLRAQL